MANCRACDAPLKVGANYCVVCGAAQHRLRGPRSRFGPLVFTICALACAALAAAFSVSFRKPDVPEAQSKVVAPSTPSNLVAPEAYLPQLTEEHDQPTGVAASEESTTGVLASRARTND